MQVTGTRYLSSFPLMMSRPSLGVPIWDQPRGENLLDGGAPWYEVYETSDGGYMSCGAMENPFYAIFLFVPFLILSSPRLAYTSHHDQGPSPRRSPSLPHPIPSPRRSRTAEPRDLARPRVLLHHRLRLSIPRLLVRPIPQLGRLLRPRP